MLAVSTTGLAAGATGGAVFIMRVNSPGSGGASGAGGFGVLAVSTTGLAAGATGGVVFIMRVNSPSPVGGSGTAALGGGVDATGAGVSAAGVTGRFTNRRVDADGSSDGPASANAGFTTGAGASVSNQADSVSLPGRTRVTTNGMPS